MGGRAEGGRGCREGGGGAICSIATHQQHHTFDKPDYQSSIDVDIELSRVQKQQSSLCELSQLQTKVVSSSTAVRHSAAQLHLRLQCPYNVIDLLLESSRAAPVSGISCLCCSTICSDCCADMSLPA